MTVLQQMPLGQFRMLYGEDETRRRILHDRAQRFSRHKRVYQPTGIKTPKGKERRRRRG
jgi:hypothetical protein